MENPRDERELLRIDAVVEREDKRQLSVATERIAELNLIAEQESVARVKLERLTEKLRKRNRTLSALSMDRNLRMRVKFIEAMRAFAGTKVYVRALQEYKADPESGEHRMLLPDARWQTH